MSLHAFEAVPGARRQADGSLLIPCPVLGHGRGQGDRNPSLHVWYDAAKNRPAFTCMSGCSFEEVRDELKSRGLLPEHVPTPRPGGPPAEVDRITYTIYNERGLEVAKHVRIVRSDGSKSFTWIPPKGVKPATMLYGLERLPKAHKDAAVVICEGEKAADAARKACPDFVALGTVTGASSCPDRAVLQHLQGRTVVLWPDNDEPGKKHMARVAIALKDIAAEIRQVDWPNAPEKADAADCSPREMARELILAAKPLGALARPENLRTYGDVANDVFRTIDEYITGQRTDVITTGMVGLNKLLNGGWQKKAISVIAAPSGGGKTTLVLQFAAASPSGALVVAPEMTVASLARRDLLRRAGVEMFDAKRDRDRTMQKLAKADGEARAARVFYLDQMEPSIEDIRAAASWMKADAGVSPLVILDYAQYLVDLTDPKRYLALARLAQAGIEIAFDLDTAVLITSQVNVDKDSKNYSIRESAFLDQKCHLRLDFYVKRPQGDQPQFLDAWFFVFKQRDGVSGVKADNLKYEPAKYTIHE